MEAIQRMQNVQAHGDKNTYQPAQTHPVSSAKSTIQASSELPSVRSLSASIRICRSHCSRCRNCRCIQHKTMESDQCSCRFLDKLFKPLNRGPFAGWEPFGTVLRLTQLEVQESPVFWCA